MTRTNNFFEGGMNITKLDRWSLELQEFDISLEFIQGKLNTVADVISHLRNEGLYHEHPNREQDVNREVNLDDRIEEILDITSKPLNFEMVFSMNTVISHKELLLYQKRDRFCRKLVRTIGRHSDFMMNHKGLLIKQVSIFKEHISCICSTTLFSTMSDQNISRQQRTSRYIQNNKHDEKTFLVPKNVRTGQHVCK